MLNYISSLSPSYTSYTLCPYIPSLLCTVTFQVSPFGCHMTSQILNDLSYVYLLLLFKMFLVVYTYGLSCTYIIYLNIFGS